MSKYQVSRTRRRFPISAMNYLQVSSTDTDLAGSEESLSNGRSRLRSIDEANATGFAGRYGDRSQRAILSTRTRFGRDSATISFGSSAKMRG